MVEAWESEMGVGSALCGSVRAKVNRHEWDNGALRLLISGERLPASAHKYARGLQQPPMAVRARLPRQVNGRVANDGPAWNIPAGLVLAGAEAIDTVESETYVWRTGDSDRISRELHEAILALVLLGGLVWSGGSAGLNQKVGGTLTDEQRERGGVNSGCGGNQTGNAGWSGAVHTARDFSAGGAGERYFGLHLKVPADKLSATLERLVQEEGSLEPLPPLCDIDVSPCYPSVTKAKGYFGLDEGRVVLRVHNSNKPNVCVSEGAIPVTTRTPPFKVPVFAIGPLRAGKVIIRNQSNANALRKNKKN